MATFRFNAYKVHEVTEFFSEFTGKKEKLVSISFGFGEAPPFPSETVEASKLEDAAKAFAAYAEKAKETGKQLSLSARVIAGRKPNGFDKAKDKFSVHVNV